MSHPTPLRSFIGGLSLPVPVHALMLLNGNVFGISGFIHRAAKGSVEAAAGVAGLVLGGMMLATLDGEAPPALVPPISQVALSGVLVGLGTKLSNGCTSGHMICGLSRFSVRSLVATLSFFTTGVITAQLFHRDLPAVGSFDWSLGPNGTKYLLAQALPLAASLLLYALRRNETTKHVNPPGQTEESSLLETPSKGPSEQAPHSTCPDTEANPPNRLLRTLGFFTTANHFALALHLSNLTDPLRVLSFLLLPFHRAFDPSLAFLAAGALPLSIALYRYARGNEKPCLGGQWSVPKSTTIDLKLVGGAAIFGIGWGLAGICPGPGLVNFGRALVGGANASQFATWLASMVVGGLLV
ncbi:hypothetical protein CC1G_13873 [Coprinopsis cinerea okayama7|uniref:Uncharacterized protein n=1 Tax=Coprinopsis cinerea (strain Okayama-7 / 130 / ATCC MYA-4618 / FGSC 9003) TaxID=240176 RepID=D6RKG2_COPC7|nr:hypothetical protein CC1G_13873 [Coprinopsis cinerea okayama7\|eukprot:XP_002911837.1 hypothetical protein CC1G_13873 [Coprinopsis cinerea okayama7\